MSRIYLLLFVSAFISCSTPQTSVIENEKAYALAKPKPEWIAQRVADSKGRLEASEAGQLILNSINYHGGLEKWWSNGPVHFRFNYQPKSGTPRDTYEVADYWSSKTKHQRVSDTTEYYGWDGENAWYFPANAEIPYNTRFWALTPYYFAGMPFVFADEGVNLVKEEDIEYDGEIHHIVRVTFGENIGDAPDDYYVLYINAKTYRLAAIRYVVSYPAYYQNGGHSQEKLMTYEGEQTIDGITFPQKHRTFMWEADGTVGDYVTDITLSDIEFKPKTQQSYFEMPEGSKVINGLQE